LDAPQCVFFQKTPAKSNIVCGGDDDDVVDQVVAVVVAAAAAAVVVVVVVVVFAVVVVVFVVVVDPKVTCHFHRRGWHTMRVHSAMIPLLRVVLGAR